MKLFVLPLVLSLTLGISTAHAQDAAAHAQDLPAGHWEGTITGPDSTTDDILLMLSYRPDGQPELKIAQPGFPEGMGLSARHIEMDSTRLFFGWNPGVPVFCSLYRQEDDSLEGTCLDPRGEEGHVKVLLK